MTIRSPVPYFGSKRLVADKVWQRLGQVTCFAEPFLGSGAVYLACPYEIPHEIINDRDCLCLNFWRSMKYNPKLVASYADDIVSQVDMFAKHEYIKQRSIGMRDAMEKDHTYCDFECAGIWGWLACLWIGGGIGTITTHQVPSNNIRGFLRKSTRDNIPEYFDSLCERLKHTKVFCGDWKRCLTPAQTTYHGLTGVFLDPPYSDPSANVQVLYKHAGTSASKESQQWAINNGDNPKLRIAFCGYDSEYTFPENWSIFHWKSAGGYGNAGNGQGRENSHRETIWFSPHCLPEGEIDLCLKT